MILTVMMSLLGIYLSLTTIYILTLTFASYFFKKKGALGKQSSICVVIPAHNEEGQVVDLLRGIQSADYPQDLLRIVVIADNCTDDTARLARRMGAQVFERTNPQLLGKGAALNWLICQHQEVYDSSELLTIIDADTLPDKSFFRELSYSFADPSVQVVQGYYTVLNPQDNWMTALSLAALSLVHHLRPAGRNALGASCGLKGNGMAFRSRLLKKTGWPCNSIVEDIEFSLFLLKKRVFIHYNPDAIVYGEMPMGRAQAEPQRTRWEYGRLELLKKYGGSLLKQAWTQKSWQYFESFLNLLTAPLSLLVVGNGLLALHLPILALIHLGLLSIYVIGGIWSRKPPNYVWVALLAVPFFILFKLLMYAKLLITRPSRWNRTKRKRETG